MSVQFASDPVKPDDLPSESALNVTSLIRFGLGGLALELIHQGVISPSDQTAFVNIGSAAVVAIGTSIWIVWKNRKSTALTKAALASPPPKK